MVYLNIEARYLLIELGDEAGLEIPRRFKAQSNGFRTQWGNVNDILNGNSKWKPYPRPQYPKPNPCGWEPCGGFLQRPKNPFSFGK